MIGDNLSDQSIDFMSVMQRPNEPIAGEAIPLISQK